MKPAFPKNPPYVELTGIKARLTSDFKRYSNGSMVMAIAEAKISEAGTNKRVGDIRFNIDGSSVAIHDERTGRTYRVDSLDL